MTIKSYKPPWFNGRIHALGACGLGSIPGGGIFLIYLMTIMDLYL